MSLVNDYLKRLGNRPRASNTNSRRGVLPALQQRQNTSSQQGKKKQIVRYGWMAIGAYCVGYFLFSVVTLSQHPQGMDTGPAEAIDPLTRQQTAVVPPAMDATKDLPSESVATLPKNSIHAVQPEPVVQEKSRAVVPTTTVSPQEQQQPVQPTDTVVATKNAVLEQQPAPTQEKQAPGENVIPITKQGVPAAPGEGKETIVSRVPEKEAAADTAVRSSTLLPGVQTDPSAPVRQEPYPLAEDGSYTTVTVVDTDSAEEPSRRVVFTESGNKPAYYYQIALQAQHNNDYGRAERYYLSVLEEEPDHENSLVNLSAIYIQEQRFQEAQAILDKVLAINTNNSKALVNAGMIALREKQIDTAHGFFQKALQYNPIEETALLNLAYLAQKKEKFDEAETYFEKLLRIAPENLTVLLAYAGLKEKKEQYASAVALYRQGLKILSLQQDQDQYERIKQRIQILRQYGSQQAYKDFFEVSK